LPNNRLSEVLPLNDGLPPSALPDGSIWEFGHGDNHPDTGEKQGLL
jgi:hypothetical protein